jgi:hypothetical protein
MEAARLKENQAPPAPRADPPLRITQQDINGIHILKVERAGPLPDQECEARYVFQEKENGAVC